MAAKTPIPNAAISLASFFMTELTVDKSTIKPTKAPTTTIISPILLSRPLRLNFLKVSIKAMIRKSDPTAPTIPSVFVSLILPAKAVKVTSRTRTVASSNIFSVVSPNLRSANFLIALARTYIAAATPRTATVPTANLVVIVESKKVVPASTAPIAAIATIALIISPQELKSAFLITIKAKDITPIAAASLIRTPLILSRILTLSSVTRLVAAVKPTTIPLITRDRTPITAAAFRSFSVSTMVSIVSDAATINIAPAIALKLPTKPLSCLALKTLFIELNVAFTVSAREPTLANASDTF